MHPIVYADNAATTRLTEPVLQAMLPYLTDLYGNASSLYSLGLQSARAIEKARGQVAAALGAQPNEIYFTGCGTESDNWLRALALALKQRGKGHLITSSIEHHALLHSMVQLEKEGCTVSYLPVDKEGRVSVSQLEAALRPETGLVSIMFANNEIGTLQPIAEIGALCRRRGILFHTDAVQAVGHVPVDVGAMNIDLLSLSAHKFHGPKGVGAFYCRRGIALPGQLLGGAQERGKRAGTENVAGIVGLGCAIELACAQLEENAAKVSALRDRLIDGILAAVPRCHLNGPREGRLPGNANFSFLGIEGESLLLRLDQAGIMASSGSACASASLDPSHVLLALGLPHEEAHGSLRLSLSEENTPEDIDYVLRTLPAVVAQLRELSPLWESLNA